MPQITWGVIEVSRVLSRLSLTHLLSSQANTFLLNTLKSQAYSSSIELSKYVFEFINFYLKTMVLYSKI